MTKNRVDYKAHLWNIRTDGVRTQGKRKEQVDSECVTGPSIFRLGDYCYIVLYHG